ncbi:MAG: antibiotic biosynthesis monooxygenase [Bacteroidia bacterium]
MSLFASTPKPPYYAVIFTSVRTENELGYNGTTARMVELARQQEGFLGMESARAEIGITVSYWADLESIKKWKENTEHLAAQEAGKNKWYSSYKVRICKVEKDYGF